MKKEEQREQLNLASKNNHKIPFTVT